MLKNAVNYVVYLRVKNCNPNGDPDNDGAPRKNYDNNKGLITDVCIKSWIKNAVKILHQNEDGFAMFVDDDGIAQETKANAIIQKCQEMVRTEKFDGDTSVKDPLMKLEAPERTEILKRAIAARYYDVRCNGGVITTFSKKSEKKDSFCDGKITGPVQVSMGESLEPVYPEKVSITRRNITTEEDKKRKDEEFGKKWIIPDAVYRFTVSVSPFLAEKSGFDENDLAVLEEALMNLCTLNNSATRTGMSVEKIIRFEQEGSRVGFQMESLVRKCISVEKCLMSEVNGSEEEASTVYYEIQVKEDSLPKSVQVQYL